MVLNKFNLLVLLQIVGIAGVGLLLALSLDSEFMQMTIAGLILLWLGQILFLSYFISRIQRDVYKFMEALRNQDTAQLFNQRNRGRYFNKLYALFNEITRNFRLVRIEKETENQFFRETIRQSASGILVLAEGESISLINDAALRILDMKGLTSLSELAKIHPQLASFLKEEIPRDGHVDLLIQGRKVQVAVKATGMILQGSEVRIFSLLDISSEMAATELEAWQKLIRVLNHEITNSITPINMLSTSLLDMFHREGTQLDPGEFDEELINRTVLGLKTLVKRSGGLAGFLNTYNSFSELGEPQYSSMDIEELFQRILSLLADDLEKGKVSMEVRVSPAGLQVQADEKLIEQSLINLVKNAIHACNDADEASIRLSAQMNEGKVQVMVSDNGKGIPVEIMDQIFTPFFTTRKDGSGIGLSLARQVMQMHGGSIHAESEVGKYSTFTLVFPQ